MLNKYLGDSNMETNFSLLVYKIRNGSTLGKLQALDEISSLVKNNNLLPYGLIVSLVENVINELDQTARLRTSVLLHQIAIKNKNLIPANLIKLLEQAEATERGLTYPDEYKIWDICTIISTVKIGKIDIRTTPNGVVIAYCRRLNDPDLNERKIAAKYIYDIASVKPQSIPNWALDYFIKNLSDPDREIKIYTVATLSNISRARPEFITHDAIPTLAIMLKDKEDEIKVSTSMVLKYVAPRMAGFITGRNMIALIENLDSKDSYVSDWAGEAFITIAAIKPRLYKEAMSILAQSLSSEDVRKRSKAVNLIDIAIIQLPQYVTDDVVAALGQSIDDSDKEVRELAAECIEAITKAREDLADKNAKQGSPGGVDEMAKRLDEGLKECQEKLGQLSPLERLAPLANEGIVSNLMNGAVNKIKNDEIYAYIQATPALFGYYNAFTGAMTSAVNASSVIGSGMVKDSRKTFSELAMRGLHIIAENSSVPFVPLVTGLGVVGAEMVAGRQRQAEIKNLSHAFPNISSHDYIEATGRALTLEMQGLIIRTHAGEERSNLSMSAEWLTWFGIREADNHVSKLAVGHAAILIDKLMKTSPAIVVNSEAHVSQLVEWALGRDVNDMKAINDNAQEKGAHAAKVMAESKQSSSESKGRSFLGFSMGRGRK